MIEVLGPPDAFGVDVEIIIRKHHLPHISDECVGGGFGLCCTDSGVAGRGGSWGSEEKGFRGLGRSSRSMARRRGISMTLCWFDRWQMAIGSCRCTLQMSAIMCAPARHPLDLEARLRGTSVYFPTARFRCCRLAAFAERHAVVCGRTRMTGWC